MDETKTTDTPETEATPENLAPVENEQAAETSSEAPMAMTIEDFKKSLLTRITNIDTQLKNVEASIQKLTEERLRLQGAGRELVEQGVRMGFISIGQDGALQAK